MQFYALFMMPDLACHALYPSQIVDCVSPKVNLNAEITIGTLFKTFCACLAEC